MVKNNARIDSRMTDRLAIVFTSSLKLRNSLNSHRTPRETHLRFPACALVYLGFSMPTNAADAGLHFPFSFTNIRRTRASPVTASLPLGSRALKILESVPVETHPHTPITL